MARFGIIDAKTGDVKLIGTPRYNGAYCKVSYLEFAEICSDVPIEWNIGDYVCYSRTGMTYKLYDIPQPKKIALKYEYGGAFVYQNVQFFPDTKWLEIEPFRDLVPADNDIHFTTQASWSVWTRAADLIGRFNAVMQTAHPGEWEFRLVDATEGTPLYKLLYDTWFDFTISGENVLQGLTKLYDLCGNIGWTHSVELDDDDNPVNIITVGVPPIYTEGIGSITNVFKFGIGQGLTEIRKSTTNRNELKTRLFAYGSTRNMIPRYYNGLDIKDAESVYIPNLMLPLSEWKKTEVDGVEKKDASKAYIDNNITLYGLRPETVYFDGSDGQKDIYPSLEETTIGQLYDAMPSGATYRPDLSKHGRSVRLDEIEDASGIVDDGQTSQGGDKYYASMEIPVSTSSMGGMDYLEVDLVERETASHTGRMTIPLSRVSIIAQTSLLVYYFNYYVIATVAGRTYQSEEKSATPFAIMSIVLPDINVICTAGDDISVKVVFRTKTDRTFSVLITGTTLTAGISQQMRNEFVVRIPQIGFDISARARLGNQGIATISMRDGKCGGRSFVVKSVQYNATLDSWELTIYRGEDESLNLLFPNTTYPIASGDHFVLLDIAMPDTYIGMAEQKLLSAATALLDDISSPKPFYEPMIDAKYMLEEGRILLEGMYMSIEDEDIIPNAEHILVDTLVINEGESSIPTYKVTLKEQKRVEYNNSQSSGSQLTSLASDTNTPATNVGGLTPEQEFAIKNFISWFGEDSEGNIFVKRSPQGTVRNFYTFGDITAGATAAVKTAEQTRQAED